MRSNHTRSTAGRVIHSSLRLFGVCVYVFHNTASAFSLFFRLKLINATNTHAITDIVYDWNVCVRAVSRCLFCADNNFKYYLTRLLEFSEFCSHFAAYFLVTML